MITPSEARKLDSISKKAESIIDKAIRSSAKDNHWPCTIALSLFGQLDQDGIDQILFAYRQEGWVVDLISDFRDGDFFSFSKP